MTPWYITLLIALVAGLVSALVVAWLARRNARWSNRQSHVLKESAAVYVTLAAQGNRYLRDIPVDPKLLSDAEFDTKVKTYASDKVKKRWEEFRNVIEPLGSYQSFARMAENAANAPATMSVDEINQQQGAEDNQLQNLAKKHYNLLMDEIRSEVGNAS